MLRDDLKRSYLYRFINVLSVILLISLIEYVVIVLFHNGIVLYHNLQRTDTDDVRLLQIFNQYLFNLIIQNDLIPRFQSLCEEPGCVGTLCGLLIFPLQRDKKHRFQYIVFIVAGILSMSLAFYALFLLHLLIGRKFTITSCILAAIIVILFYYFKDSFEEGIILRLQSGRIDNRLSEDFSYQFDNAWTRGELWLPHGQKSGSFGAGAKMWLWKYGIIAFIPLFLSYCYYYYNKVKRYHSALWPSIIFFVTFWISFYQRHLITNFEYMMVFLVAPIIWARSLYNKGVSVKSV